MRISLIVAGLNGAAAMVILSFAAHSAERIVPPEQIELMKRGAELHLWHALALLGVAALSVRCAGNRWFSLATIAFQAGIILFSGSLYWLGLMGPDTLGPFGLATPLGGLALIAGWLSLVGAGLTGWARRGSH
jgi:uncharacterized membrane protein YgdD (TMEM256/DUF423 family)